LWRNDNDDDNDKDDNDNHKNADDDDNDDKYQIINLPFVSYSHNGAYGKNGNCDEWMTYLCNYI
jgi:hypothetical protein